MDCAPHIMDAKKMMVVRLQLLLCCATVSGNDAAGVSGRPNILLHVVDDLGWNDLGYQRSALPGQHNAMDSPHLDSLARDGVRLHDFAVFKFCSPSRSDLLKLLAGNASRLAKILLRFYARLLG